MSLENEAFSGDGFFKKPEKHPVGYFFSLILPAIKTKSSKKRNCPGRMRRRVWMVIFCIPVRNFTKNGSRTDFFTGIGLIFKGT